MGRRKGKEGAHMISVFFNAQSAASSRAGLKGRALLRLYFLLVTLIFAGVSAQTLQDDEQHFIAFLKNVLPNYTLIYNSSVPTCEWKGLMCIGLGAQQRIYRLSLGGLQLNGSIPYGSLGSLSALTVLDLSNNNLSGDIPYDVWQLRNLMRLALAGNSFTGTLPWAVNGLTQLQELFLGDNRFGGELPRSLGDVWSLKVLDVHGNNFTGLIPPLVSNKNLQYLDLSSNGIAGILPIQTFLCLELLTLNLSRNLLSGALPSDLNRLSKLRSLDLSENGFEGQIPDLSNLGQLRLFNASSNRLSGDFPFNVTKLPFIQSISLANNSLWGSLWGMSTNNTNLVVLDVANNFMSGSIPDFLLAPANLTVLRLGRNSFSGPVPSRVNEQLQELDLHRNNLTGEIPATFSSLGVLRKLDVSANYLNGSIPWGVTAIASLQYLSLAGNGFEAGPLPDFTLMQNLGHLNLSSCNVNGSIPVTLGRATNLTTLDISHNYLTGTIPQELTALLKLTSLSLSSNNLSGPVPSANRWSSFNRSSFEPGNPLLCGIELNRVCSDLFLQPPAASPSPPALVLPPPLPSSQPPPLSQPPAEAPLRGSGPRVLDRQSDGDGLQPGTIAAIVVAGILFLVASLTIIVLAHRRFKYKNVPTKEPGAEMTGPVAFETDPSGWAAQVIQPASIPVIMFEKPLLNLTFADLLHATNKFHKDSQLTDSRYGLSFKGVLPGGFQIVVKVLYEGGPGNELEKAAQLEALGKIRHENLVPLVGYCLVGGERLLVYQFMENGDVYSRIHDSTEETHHPDHWTSETWEDAHERFVVSEELSWPIRHRIAVGVARALAFLHHGCSPNVIHRDVTSSNIMLDSQYEPHLAGCGLAGLVDSTQKQLSMMAPVMGGMTLGYIPPEYGQTWNVTPRGDVYSFGVVLLELVTGKRPTGHYFHDSYGGNLVGWVRALIREKRGYKCLDPKLLSTGVESEMLETLRIGYLCTAELPTKRPTIQQVVGLLKDIHVEVTYSSY